MKESCYEKTRGGDQMKKGKSILSIILLGISILAFGVGNVFFFYEGQNSLQITSMEAKENTEQEDDWKKEDKKEEENIIYTSSLNGFQTGKMSAAKTKNEKAETNENSKDYILADSGSKYYTKEDLKKLSKWEVQLARNEIYARHGRIFTTDEIREYFEGKDWYRGTVEDVADSELNQYEIANRDMILKYEKSKGWR